MKRVYLIRHGQTTANANRVCQGPEEPLSTAGEMQAIRLAERTQHLDFDNIISSDYRRALQTAEAIRKLKDVPLVTSHLFREERWPSSYDGLPEEDEVRRGYVSALDENADNQDWAYEDAENVHAVMGRIEQGLRLLEAEESQSLLVVSHGNFLKQLLGFVLLKEKARPSDLVRFKYTLQLTNTGISVITYEDRWRLLTWNDHAHFAE